MLDHPRLITRKAAAAYCGMGPDSFDARVKDGTFPAPLLMGKRKIWDIKAIDRALDIMSGLAKSDVTPDSSTSDVIRRNIDKHLGKAKTSRA